MTTPTVSSSNLTLPASNFKYSCPLNFYWLNSNDEPVMLILGGDNSQKAQLKIFNNSNANLTFNPTGNDTAGSSNYHLSVSFRPGILQNPSDITLTDVFQATDSVDLKNWSCTVETASDTGVTTIYLLSTQQLQLSTQSTTDQTHSESYGDPAQLTLWFDPIEISSTLGACNSRVMLNYNNLQYGSTDVSNKAATISDSLEQVISIVNHVGSPNAPIAAGFVGGNTIVSNGTTENSLQLNIWNTSSTVPLLLTNNGQANNSKVIVSLEAFDDGQSGVGSSETTANLSLPKGANQKAQLWSPSSNSSEADQSQWTLTANCSELNSDQPLVIELTNILTKTTNNQMRVKVQYQNIPGYWDGVCYANIFVSCLDISTTAVAIGGLTSQDSALAIDASTTGNDGARAIYGTSQSSDHSTAYFVNKGSGYGIAAENNGNSQSTAYFINKGEGVGLEVVSNAKSTFSTAKFQNSGGGQSAEFVNSSSSAVTTSIVNSGEAGALDLNNSGNGSTLQVTNTGSGHSIYATSKSTSSDDGCATAYIGNNGTGQALYAYSNSSNNTSSFVNGSGGIVIWAVNKGNGATASFTNGGSGSALAAKSGVTGGSVANIQNSGPGHAIWATNASTAEDVTCATAYLKNEGPGYTIYAVSNGEASNAATAYISNTGDGQALYVESKASIEAANNVSESATATFVNNGGGAALSIIANGGPQAAGYVQNKGAGYGLYVVNSSENDQAALYVDNNSSGENNNGYGIYGIYATCNNGNSIVAVSDDSDKGVNNDGTVYIFNAKSNSHGYNAIGLAVWGDFYLNGNTHNSASFSYSDQRIKDVVGKSDGLLDLSVLQKIEITDFQYKAKMVMGSVPQKKVIAQQVQSIYPQAVKGDSSHFLPNVLKDVKINRGTVNCSGVDLKDGDRVRIVISDKIIPHFFVSDVTPSSFKIDYDFTGDGFFYGVEVNDFLSVDYDALSCLNISATQELARQVEQQQKEIETLKETVTRLCSQLDKTTA